MFYRITADLSFETEQDAKDTHILIKKALAKCKTIKKGQPEEEKSYVILQQCYHDETPTRPCEIIDSAFPTP